MSRGLGNGLGAWQACNLHRAQLHAGRPRTPVPPGASHDSFQRAGHPGIVHGFDFSIGALRPILTSRFGSQPTPWRRGGDNQTSHRLASHRVHRSRRKIFRPCERNATPRRKNRQAPLPRLHDPWRACGEMIATALPPAGGAWRRFRSQQMKALRRHHLGALAQSAFVIADRSGGGRGPSN
jgi:hypothetical protein